LNVQIRSELKIIQSTKVFNKIF